jgi:2-amino-4-hydroxy-6-hydroxymethyldihydropteridine diphosphokinase
MISQPRRFGPRCPAAVDAYIGIGANLGRPQRQIEQAFVALRRLPRTRLTAISSLYRTTPVGPQDQPDYINAAAGLRTRLTPTELLGALQSIEQRLGRVRDGRRWGPRMLDLDLLLYGDLCLDTPALRLPHPWMHRRGFVLVPLADIAPAGLLVPGRGRLTELLSAVGRGGIQRVERPCPDGSPVDFPAGAMIPGQQGLAAG